MGKAASALRSQEAALRKARSFIERVSGVVRLVEAYLIGSRARGDYLEDSDIDLVLIVEGVDQLNQKQRVELLSEYAEPGVEYRVYTPVEWYGEASLWIREVKREAKLLWRRGRWLLNAAHEGSR